MNAWRKGLEIWLHVDDVIKEEKGKKKPTNQFKVKYIFLNFSILYIDIFFHV